jgi:hypothetical protein
MCERLNLRFDGADPLDQRGCDFLRGQAAGRDVARDLAGGELAWVCGLHGRIQG